MKIWTIIDIIKWGVEYFSVKNIDSPRLTIELMVCEVLNLKRLDLYLKFEQPLNQSELDALRLMVQRRVKREPLQHILGYTDFLGCKILVNPDVLVPRPETELLADAVIKDYKNIEGMKILDIGTGSGCIAISLARNLKTQAFYACDCSLKALEIAKENARHNNVVIDFFEYDILSNIENTLLKQKFDIIVSNPPYIPQKELAELAPEVAHYDPKNALTDYGDGLSFYRKFAELFPLLLNEGGRFYLEIGFGQFEDVQAIFSNKGIRVIGINDFSNITRIVTNC